MAEAGLVAFGGHVNKQGINPFADTGAYSNNENLYGVKVKPSQNLEENRLYQLTKAAWQGTSFPYDGNNVVLNNGINVMTYTGGPGSNLGVGNTGIRYSLTSQTPLTLFPRATSFTTSETSVGQNDFAYSSELLETQPKAIEEFGIGSPKTQDFRAKLRATLQGRNKDRALESGATPYAPDYTRANIENRVNLGDPGQRSGKSYAVYSDGVTTPDGSPYYNSVNTNLGSYATGLDKITSIPVYRSENVIQDQSVNDLVKFRIAVIDNDAPNFKTFMHFRAFLGPMSDSYNANWNSFQYLGRGENFYTYGGFTRQISLSWTVAAQSKEELIPMYKKLNYLASTLAPDYSPNGFMRGNLVQLTVGGYLYEQPGFITNLTYDIQEDTPWEIGIGAIAGQDGSVKELPHIIRVTGFNFTPIQRFRPQLQDNDFSTNGVNTQGTGTGMTITEGPERFIALANGTNANQTNYNS